MARVRGSFNIDSNYDLIAKRPFDARMLVPTYADLTTKDNWLALDENGNHTTSLVAYNGMLVAVADKNDIENSGLYMLFDISGKKNPNVELADNWIKIGETSDISSFAERLSSIEEELDSIKDRLTSLEGITGGVETVGYRANFPVPGTENILYVAVDEQKSYVWVNDDYLPVGENTDNIKIIHGGTAD